MKLIKKLWARICQGLKVQANSEEYAKTGRYLGDDPEFPGTYRPELNGKIKKVKTTAAAVVVAATTVAVAQAGLFTPAGGDSPNSGSGGGFWGNVWSTVAGFFSSITAGDIAQGLSSANTNPISATANDAAYATQQAELAAAKKDK